MRRVFKILESWGEASGEYVVFMSLAFGGVGSAWASPVDLKTLAIPPPIGEKTRPRFVYSLFDPGSGEVVVWIFELPESVFKGGKIDEKSLKNLKESMRRLIDGLWELSGLCGTILKSNSALSCLGV